MSQPEMDTTLSQTSTTPLRLYNSLTRCVEAFRPHQQPVTVYVCGITPYNTTHLGHLFTYATADTLMRYLEYSGWPVTYVQNLTDVDNAILREAQAQDEFWRDLGNRWTRHFMHDMQALNIWAPHHYPRATEVIPEIIANVRELVAAGLAYISQGTVYFHVPAWPAYGQLSQLSRQEMLSRARDNGFDSQDASKRDALDFPLWRAQQPGEPAWDSPWGSGRPGCHIECSTMASHFLGEMVDMHIGGSDLLFPHHESELAQAEGATGVRPFVRYWMHVGMVQIEGEKMSKSRRNLVMVRDLLQRHSADTLRLYLAMHHYRQSWSYDAAALHESEEMYKTVREAAQVPSGPRTAAALEVDDWRRELRDSMDDDLQTPRAVAAMVKLANAIRTASRERCNIDNAQRLLREFGQLFGLRLHHGEPEERVRLGWDTHLARLQLARLQLARLQ